MMVMRRTLLAWLLCSATAWAYGGSTTQVILGGSTSASTTATNYAPFNSQKNSIASPEIQNAILTGTAGTVTDMTATVATAPGAGKQWTVTLRVDAANSALSCVISGTNTSCTDTDTVALSAGQQLDVATVPASTPASTATISWSFHFIPTTPGDNLYGGGTDETMQTAATDYQPVFGVSFSYATEADVKGVVSTSGTFKNLYVKLSGTPNNGGGTQKYTFTIRKNGANTAITCAIQEAGTTCNDTTNTFTVVAGDLINMSSVPSGGPTARSVVMGVDFVPNTPGEFMFVYTDDHQISASATTYAPIQSMETNWNTTETNVNEVGIPLTLRNFYAWVATDPNNGAGTQSYAFTIRLNNTTNTAQTCTISEGSTTCSVTGVETAVASGDLLTISSVPSNTPVVSANSQGVLCFITPRRIW